LGVIYDWSRAESMNKTIISEDLNQILASPVDWRRFADKTVLISGANGFLPAYMVETIMSLSVRKIIQNTKVIALVRNISKAKIRFQKYLTNKNLELIEQDVCDAIKIEQKIDFIIHAASQASPKYYGSDPVGTLNVNILGTINLLKVAYLHSVESFLYFSSSEVYGSIDEALISTKESDYGYIDPTNVRSCYSESKRMGETICVSWFHQYKVPIKIVRPFHTYGPGMSLDDGRVFADFVSNVVKMQDITLKSTGKAKRAFCYISDATVAFFIVLLNGINGEAYNIGNPDAEVRIIDLAHILVNTFPEKKLKVVRGSQFSDGYINSTIMKQTPDISKINKIGWWPKINIIEGFTKTIKYYE